MVRSVRIDGKKFAALVEQRLMSQKAFADAGGVGPSTVFRLSRAGVHGMLVNRFRQLAAALNLTPDELRARIGADETSIRPTVPAKTPAPPAYRPIPIPSALADFLAGESARHRIAADQLLLAMLAHFKSMPESERRKILAGAGSDARLRLAASPMGPRAGKPAKKFD